MPYLPILHIYQIYRKDRLLFFINNNCNTMLNNNEDIRKKIPDDDSSPQIFKLISHFKLIDENIPQHYSPSSCKQIPTAETLSEEIGYFNNTAIHKIDNNQFKEALIFLKEAQNLLETGLKNQIKINGIHIVCIMKNMACVYQKLYQLEKAEIFMKAIIQNIQSQIKFQQFGKLNKENIKQPTKSQKQSIKWQIYTNFYILNTYLQYFAVCSQLGKHIVALQCLKKVLNLLKDNCRKLSQLQIIACYQNPSSKIQMNNSLQNIMNIKQTTDSKSITDTITQISKMLPNVKSISPQLKMMSQQLTCIQKLNFAKITQISHTTIDQCYESFNITQFSMKTTKVKIIFYFSFYYLCLAAQNRLLSAQKFSQNRKFTQSFKISKAQHLISIIIFIKYININCEYLQYILEGFEKHYEINIKKNKIVNRTKNQKQKSSKTSLQCEQDLIFQNRMLQQSIVDKYQDQNQQSSTEAVRNYSKKQIAKNGVKQQQNDRKQTNKVRVANSYGIQERVSPKKKQNNGKNNKNKGKGRQKQKSTKKTSQKSTNKISLKSSKDNKGGHRTSKSSKNSKTSAKQQYKNSQSKDKSSANSNKIISNRLITNKLAKYGLNTQQLQVNKNIKMISSEKVLLPPNQYRQLQKEAPNIKQKFDTHSQRNSNKSQQKPTRRLIVINKPSKDRLVKIQHQQKASQQYLLRQQTKKSSREKKQKRKPYNSLKQKPIKKLLKNNSKDPKKSTKKIGSLQKQRSQKNNVEEVKKLGKKNK